MEGGFSAWLLINLNNIPAAQWVFLFLFCWTGQVKKLYLECHTLLERDARQGPPGSGVENPVRHRGPGGEENRTLRGVGFSLWLRSPNLLSPTST